MSSRCCQFYLLLIGAVLALSMPGAATCRRVWKVNEEGEVDDMSIRSLCRVHSLACCYLRAAEPCRVFWNPLQD